MRLLIAEWVMPSCRTGEGAGVDDGVKDVEARMRFHMFHLLTETVRAQRIITVRKACHPVISS